MDGSDDTQIKGAGRWRGMGFREYADIQLTDALKMSRLAARTSLSDREGDPGAPTNIAFAEPLRKRMRPFPAREIQRRPPSILTGGTGFLGCSISREALRIGRYKASSYMGEIPRWTRPRAPRLTSDLVCACVGRRISNDQRIG